MRPLFCFFQFKYNQRKYFILQKSEDTYIGTKVQIREYNEEPVLCLCVYFELIHSSKLKNVFRVSIRQTFCLYREETTTKIIQSYDNIISPRGFFLPHFKSILGVSLGIGHLVPSIQGCTGLSDVLRSCSFLTRTIVLILKIQIPNLHCLQCHQKKLLYD